MIGIIGGIGPLAGINLASRIIHFTDAKSDQEHLPMILMSSPEEVKDRTEYLMGRCQENPAYALAKQIIQLEKAGASVAGMACNTAHASDIFSVILEQLRLAGCPLEPINLILETVEFIKQNSQPDDIFGILGTNGAYLTGLYSRPLQEAGWKVLNPGEELQDAWVHQAIYDPEFGIKATGIQVSGRAIHLLQQMVDLCREQSCNQLLLGCSEITLAIDRVNTVGINLIRPMDILAQALIREYKKSVFLGR